MGSAHYSHCKMKQGKVCDYEVEDMKCPRGEHNENVLCFAHAATSPCVFFVQKTPRFLFSVAPAEECSGIRELSDNRFICNVGDE